MSNERIYKHLISSLYKMLCWREENKRWQTIYDEFLLDYDGGSCVVNKKVGYNEPVEYLKGKRNELELANPELNDLVSNSSSFETSKQYKYYHSHWLRLQRFDTYRIT